MPEKKRKRESNGQAERPLKKVAVADPTTSGTVKVSLLQDTNEWTPLLGNHKSSLHAASSFSNSS